MSKDLLKLPTETTLDRIIASYDKQAGIILTEKEKEVEQRLRNAFTILAAGWSVKETAQKLMKVNKKEISLQTAYRDIADAKKLFGDIEKSTKEGDRAIISEMAIRVYRLAMKNRNFREMNVAVANLIKLKGLAQEIANLPKWEELAPHKFDIVIPPELLDHFKKMIATGSVNLTDRKIEGVIDISHEEIEDGSGPGE